MEQIKKGKKVKILSKVSGISHRKNKNGIITGVNGYYIYVRPMYCKWEVELYPCEIEVL